VTATTAPASSAPATSAPAESSAPAATTAAETTAAETTAAATTAAAALSGKISLAGSTSVQPLAEDLAKAFSAKYPDVKIDIQGGGSSVGVSSATDGTADIGNVSRSLTDDEKKVLKPYVIALDGIAVAVSPKNPVKNLTADQVTQIFNGTIKNWKEVGGEDKAIIVCIRESSSGTRDAFQGFFKLQSKDASGKLIETVTEKAVQTNDNGSMMTNIAGKDAAIGYCSLGSANDTIKLLTVDGVAPSEATVLDGSYKYQRPFVMATKGDAAGLAKSFIDWIMSDEGKAIISKKYVIPKA
jgi:phosphate transport system substrate-binding protein